MKRIDITRYRILVSSNRPFISSLLYRSFISNAKTTPSKKLQWDAIHSAKPFSHFLTDNFNRQHDYLRISISERCNLRCIYCMPEEGVELSPPSHILSKAEIIKIAKLFVSEGVNKIRITGGEPSVRKDFLEIMKELNEIDGLKEIAITSNGISLGRKIPLLKEYGLTSLNLSLDTLVEGKYMIMTRRNGLSKVLNTLDQALHYGIPKVKINVVVMKGINDDEILDFVNIAKEKPVEIRFIEYMPFSGNKWSTNKMVSYEEMLKVITDKYPNLHQLPSSRGDTAKLFTDANFVGKVGFITSMTSHFCGSCNRLRITSDGNLKVCLFGNTEVSLRDMIRQDASDYQLLEVIGKAVKNKKEKHAGIGELEKMENRPMILIGGLVNMRKEVYCKLTNFTDRYPRISQQQIRHFSQTFSPKNLTHVTSDGSAHMVDIANKKETHRSATAKGTIKFSNIQLASLITNNELKKGDVLSTARIAGIMAVKLTPTIIPLCHPIMITKITNDLTIDNSTNSVHVSCTVECFGKTGVEMEAITGAMASLSTVYDMCKAVDKHMIIAQVYVAHKKGGKSDFDFNPSS